MTPASSRGRNRNLLKLAAAIVGSASASSVVAPQGSTAGSPPADGEARLNLEPDRLTLTDEAGNVFVAEWTAVGVMVDGYLIANRDHAEALAAFITREDDDA